jgi:hypothetical protein
LEYPSVTTAFNERKKNGRQKGIKRKKVVIYSFPTTVIVVGE